MKYDLFLIEAVFPAQFAVFSQRWRPITNGVEADVISAINASICSMHRSESLHLTPFLYFFKSPLVEVKPRSETLDTEVFALG